MNPQSQEKLRRALFLDRDGVINEEVDYLYRPEEVRFVPGIFQLCRTAQALGYALIVVTNQSGIARGFYTEADFHVLMAWIKEQFAGEGINLTAVYFCPFHPEHGIGDYRREHADRKPGPGMLLRGATDWNIALDKSVLVGDRCSDIAAANAAGLRKAFLLSGTERQPCPRPHTSVDTLASVEQWLREQPSLN